MDTPEIIELRSAAQNLNAHLDRLSGLRTGTDPEYRVRVSYAQGRHAYVAVVVVGEIVVNYAISTPLYWPQKQVLEDLQTAVIRLNDAISGWFKRYRGTEAANGLRVSSTMSDMDVSHVALEISTIVVSVR